MLWLQATPLPGNRYVLRTYRCLSFFYSYLIIFACPVPSRLPPQSTTTGGLGGLPDVAVPVRAGEGSLEDLVITVENPLKHGAWFFQPLGLVS